MVDMMSASRKIVIPAIGLAFTASWIGVMANVYSATSSLAPADGFVSRTLFVPATLDHLSVRQAGLVAGLPTSLGAAGGHEGTRAILARPQTARSTAARPMAHGTTSASATQPRVAHDTSVDRFEAVIRAASLSPDKIAAAFAAGRDPVSEMPVAGSDPSGDRFAVVAEAQLVSLPSSDRFGPSTANAVADAGYMLALALPIANVDREEQPPVEAAPQTFASISPLEQSASLSIPDAVPLPSRRPVSEKPVIAEAARQSVNDRADGRNLALKPSEKNTVAKPLPKARAEKPARNTQIASLERSTRPVVRSERDTSATAALAYAAPDDGAGSAGKAFRNLFNSGPGAAVGGKRVAVYNISAKTVTMPDGEVLAAYSGIGEMANNPKYVGVKMRGPTPPDTYKLKMRESRFHGVEAIRMLPVDGKKKFGRDGILAHTQLLRGRKGQSHGCVAFKDYDKFLNAFKKGKVTHMVVIPGKGGASPAGSGTRVASNGSRS